MKRTTFTSLEFILLILTNVAAWLATTGSTVTSREAYIYTAVSAGVYALARGLAKFNSDGKPWYKTSEFWVVVVGALSATWAGFQGHVGSVTFVEVTALLTGLAAIGNGLRTPPSQAVSGDA